MAKVSRQNLVKVLEVAIQAAGGDAVSPPLFLFNDGKVYTCNGVVAVRYDLGLQEIDGAIVAPETLKGLSKMKGEEVSVTADNGNVTFDDGQTYLTMKVVTDDITLRQQVSSLVGAEANMQWVALPESFFEGLPLVGYSMFSDVTAAPSLYGIGVKDGKLYSSDNWRISCFEAGSLDVSVEHSIPKPTVGLLLKLEQSPTRLGFDGDAVLAFDVGDGRIFSALMTEDFPFADVQAIIEGCKQRQDEFTEFEFSKEFQEALDAVKVFASEIDDFDLEAVHVVTKRGYAVVSGEIDQGRISRKVKAGNVPEVEFYANPEFLKIMLKHNRKFKYGEDIIVFETDNFMQIMQVFSNN